MPSRRTSSLQIQRTQRHKALKAERTRKHHPSQICQRLTENTTKAAVGAVPFQAKELKEVSKAHCEGYCTLSTMTSFRCIAIRSFPGMA
jgi:hypothetical protein